MCDGVGEFLLGVICFVLLIAYVFVCVITVKAIDYSIKKRYLKDTYVYDS